MAPASLPACGFAVRGTKKGELPLKTEKRARGKKVTLIPNVSGDASKLASVLQNMLAVGGTARRAEAGLWVVEVQGEQIQRVTPVLLDLGCLQGLSRDALEALRSTGKAQGGEAPAVARTAASKFLAQTQGGASQTSSPEEVRRKQLEEEAEFYAHFWQAAVAPVAGALIDDLSDVFCLGEPEEAGEQQLDAQRSAPELPELNAALRNLGLLAECGSAVRDFWERPGMTLAQFRREALRFGARLITEEPGRRKKPSNLKSRQKISDLGTGARATYFSCTCSAIDAYERGLRGKRQEAQPTPAPAPALAAAPEVRLSRDTEGWYTAELGCSLPFSAPRSRLPAEEQTAVCVAALRSLDAEVASALERLRASFPEIESHLKPETFALDLALREQESFHPGKREGKLAADKEELRLEKKLREISALQRRAVAGEGLEKLQLDKVQRRGELFGQVAELKLRRCEKEARKVLQSLQEPFQTAFWAEEWRELYGEAPGGPEAPGRPEAPEAAPGPGPGPGFGAFMPETRTSGAQVSSDGLQLEGRAAQWAGAKLQLAIQPGEVGAFAVEVLEGLVRIGWVMTDGAVAEVGADALGFGFGGSGKRVHAGVFQVYGSTFGAGDVIHCEAEREDGHLRIGFAKNSEPLGVAFDVDDRPGELLGCVSGKGFKVRALSAECMPLEEAPGLEDFVEYDPPRMALVMQDFQDGPEDCLRLWAGETVHVSSDDGQGWLFGFFLDPEDPEDGGWFPTTSVRFLDEESLETAVSCPPPTGLDSRDQAVAPGQAAVTLHPVSACTPDWDSAPLAEGAEQQSGLEPGKVSLAAPVEGLEQWLQSLSLQKYHGRAVTWCLEMGAVSLQEVEEEWEDLAEALALRPLERKRLAKAATKTSS